MKNEGRWANALVFIWKSTNGVSGWVGVGRKAWGLGLAQSLRAWRSLNHEKGIIAFNLFAYSGEKAVEGTGLWWVTMSLGFLIAEVELFEPVGKRNPQKKELFFDWRRRGAKIHGNDGVGWSCASNPRNHQRAAKVNHHLSSCQQNDSKSVVHWQKSIYLNKGNIKAIKYI